MIEDVDSDIFQRVESALARQLFSGANPLESSSIHELTVRATAARGHRKLKARGRNGDDESCFCIRNLSPRQI